MSKLSPSSIVCFALVVQEQTTRLPNVFFPFFFLSLLEWVDVNGKESLDLPKPFSLRYSVVLTSY